MGRPMACKRARERLMLMSHLDNEVCSWRDPSERAPPVARTRGLEGVSVRPRDPSLGSGDARSGEFKGDEREARDQDAEYASQPA